jgi:hypothetical protein
MYNYPFMCTADMCVHCAVSHLARATSPVFSSNHPHAAHMNGLALPEGAADGGVLRQSALQSGALR